MKIAMLGSGVEGHAVLDYFKQRGDSVEFFDNFRDENIANFGLDRFDLVFRSPSVHPQYINGNRDTNWTSITRYFFDKCPAPIIGVTGTKGKGTTCCMIHTILEAIYKKSKRIFLVGNIGVPAISILDEVTKNDIVVYEMSSFQLWDLEKSPHVAVVLRIEPDHLDRHPGYADYTKAKSNIAKNQNPNDFCIYYEESEEAHEIAELSAGEKIPYRFENYEVLNSLKIPGFHNKENASAALTAVAAALHISLTELLSKYDSEIKEAMGSFHGLPHRLQYVSTINGVDYYDDNYSSAFPALDVALNAFPDKKIVLIAGGKDRNLDLTKMKHRIFTAANLAKVILIGETRFRLAENENAEKYIIADDLQEALEYARKTAENLGDAVVVMSPGAPSFDMFRNFEDRGTKYKEIIKSWTR